MKKIFVANLEIPPPQKFIPSIPVNFFLDVNRIDTIYVQFSKFASETSKKPTNKSSIDIKLYQAEINWELGIKSFDEYLTPIKLSERANFTGNVYPYSISLESFLPLYAIANLTKMEKLITYLELSLYSIIPPDIALLFKTLISNSTLPFDRLLGTFKLLLSISKPLDIYMSTLEFAPIITLFRDKNGFITNWLISVYNIFSKKKLFSDEIHRITKNVKTVSEISTFIVWAYSRFFPDLKANISSFPLIINRFDFNVDIELDESQIYWIFKHKHSGPISNHLINCGIQYIKNNLKTKPRECKLIYDSLVKFDSFDVENLDSQQISVLIPLASDPQNSSAHFNHAKFFDLLVNRLKEIGDISEVVKENNENFLSLTWEQIVSTFDPQLENSFYLYCKWINKNRPTSSSILYEFLEIISKIKINTKQEYFLLLVFNAFSSSYLNDTQIQFLGQLKTIILNYDFISLFSYISKKKNVIYFNSQTLQFIHQRTKTNADEQSSFVNMLITKGYENIEPNILLPITNKSYMNCIKLMLTTNIKNETLNNELIKMTRLILWELKPMEIRLVSNLLPFDVVFNTDSPIILANEDKALYYYTLSKDSDMNLLNYSQISFRIASKFGEPIIFQFPPNENSLYNYITNDFNFDFDKWETFTYPRFQYHSLRQVTIYLMCPTNLTYLSIIKNCFNYIGVNEVNIYFIDNSVTSIAEPIGPIILIKPFNGITCEIPLMNAIFSRITNLKCGFAMNANALKDILNLCPQFLPNIFSFDDDFLENIQWNETPDDILPSKENLPILELRNGIDEYYHSIPFTIFKSDLVLSKMSFNGERVFAAKLKNDVAIFNFDLCLDCEKKFLECALVKGMAQCILSLFANLCDIDRIE